MYIDNGTLFEKVQNAFKNIIKKEGKVIGEITLLESHQNLYVLIIMIRGHVQITNPRYDEEMHTFLEGIEKGSDLQHESTIINRIESLLP